MRVGVLDIGSNTGHLLVVDAVRGGPPAPARSCRVPLRLTEHLDGDQAISEEGIARLIAYVVQARAQAEDAGCVDVLAFATSAVREAVNAVDVIARVNEASGIGLEVLSGDDEARLTFLAVRRWFGLSAGRLGVFDIGGGSLELAVGSDEVPGAVASLPLGAGRLTRDWLGSGAGLAELQRHVRSAITEEVDALLRWGSIERAVGTSATFRTLARMCGAAPSSEGRYVRRALVRRDLSQLVLALATMRPEDVAVLPGVPADRAGQIQAGAIVAEATMELLGVAELEICPWALREGVLLEHLGRP